MTISTRQQKQLCARLSAMRLFLLLASVLHDANQAFSIIFAEASLQRRRNECGCRKQSQDSNISVPRASAASQAAQLSVEAKALRARLIFL